MAISGDYPTPVNVNGFSCKNCTDVDNAKKHIDPAHPKDGPFGVNAKDNVDPRRAVERASVAGRDDQAAVVFGGQLAALAGAAGQSRAASSASSIAPGQRVNLSI